MIKPEEGWTAFSDANEQLEWLKSHQLTPPSYEAPKPLFYEGMYCNEVSECTVVGYADNWTAVIKVNDQLHCIHPDYLVEMQVGKSQMAKEKMQENK